ncbi:hypothetical protein DB346_24300 [Verrucomicrobia bacterium LW23]|nr:hypothetical protein DB346_24300 [Verrucomicrobia bacterium LW23]
MPSYYSTGEAENFKPLQPGEYVFMITAAEERDFNGVPTIQMKLTEEHSSSRINDTLRFTENSIWRIDQFRAACGEILKKDEHVSIYPSQLIGTVLRARTKIGKNGYAEVQAFLVPTDDQPLPDTWRGMLINRAGTSAPPARPAAAPSAGYARQNAGAAPAPSRPAQQYQRPASAGAARQEESSPFNDGGF